MGGGAQSQGGRGRQEATERPPMQVDEYLEDGAANNGGLPADLPAARKELKALTHRRESLLRFIHRAEVCSTCPALALLFLLCWLGGEH